MGNTIQDPNVNYYQNETFVNMTENLGMHNEFKIRIGEADSMTPISTARERIKYNEMNQKEMNMSHYSGFSGTKAFSGAHNNSHA